ncbi:MAG: type II secretion system F family protein [Lachnospiraceae bacterium]|nr:type II secretion system F family protein [Lachnospiraceae bacterium]
MKQSDVLGAVTILLALLWLLLAYLGRGEETEAKDTGIRRIAMKAGLYLAGQAKTLGWIRPHVKTRLAVLYPTRQIDELCREYYGKKFAVIAAFLLAGSGFVWLIVFVSQQDSLLQNSHELMRGGYEAEDEEIELVITQEDTGISRVYEHTLLGRTYPKETLEQMADALEQKLPDLILGENTDTGHIRSDLLLSTRVEDYPFWIDWESSDYSLADSDGTILNTELTAPKTATLTALLSYRDYEKEITIPVTVYPAKLSSEEKLDRQIRKQLDLSDQSQQEQATYVLPDTIQGKRVSYAISGEGQLWLLLPLLLVIAALLYVGKDKDLEKEMLLRRKKIETAYPSFVGKFVLLYGGGMSIRRVLERLGRDALQPELREELLILLRDLHNGILEQDALEMFGRRCGCASYIKFAGLLISNLKKGNTEFTQQMKEEADAAFLMRRNLARKLGEEAGTKLCFPMILMLGVVMAVIMMPAFLSF